MRFHLQNVQSLDFGTFQILFIILSAACLLSGTEAMLSLQLPSSSSSSRNVSIPDLLSPILDSALHIESQSFKPLPPKVISDSMKSPENNAFSDSPNRRQINLIEFPENKTSLAKNDSNEIDSEDYVMSRHIASHGYSDGDGDDDDAHSDADADENANENADDDGGILMHTTTEVMPLESEKEMEIDVEMEMDVDVEVEMVTATVAETANQIDLTNMHGLTKHSHSLERSLMRGRLNKTQDLSSLSLLTIDEGNTSSNEGTSTDENDDATATIQKRLVEQQQQQQRQRQRQQKQPHTQQQQQRVSGHNGIANDGGSNNIRNPSNKRITTAGNQNSTMSNFQHIGSKRITTISSSAEAASSASAAASVAVTTTPVVQPASISRSNIGSSKTSSSSGTSRKVESKYILPKPQKTDAPMLNYIFDTFSSANKHHHHDQRYGPHFEDVQRVGQPMNMTVQAGSSIHLNCRISLLQDKTVSWVRRSPLGENALDLLTVGPHTYTGDSRYKLEFQYPNNWRLKIMNVKKDDEATYECQISTHPPRVIQTNLFVNAPKVMIIDELGDPLQEKYYETDSTLQLSCIVRNVAMVNSVVNWKHGENILNHDVTRGGVSVKTELMDDGANSTLSIAKINKADSGNYTCSISEFQNFTIVVHILNGESFAELHHGGAASMMLRHYQHTLAINLTLLILLLCLPATCIPR